MFRLCILMYGLSLSEAYTIKLSGTVELGNQLSKLFKEMYSQLAENGYFPDQVFSLQDDDNPTGQKNFEIGLHPEYENNEEPEKKNKIKKVKELKEVKEVKDMPILDKMMKNDLEKLHLYGQHKVEEKRNEGPLNNINI